MATLNYLGTGIKWPLETQYGSISLVSDEELIKQSITKILSTPKGRRFMLPEFGSNVHKLLFEQNDTILSGMLKTYIEQAITEWEPRVEFISCEISMNENSAQCSLQYRVLRSGQFDGFIHPYYRQLAA